MLRFDAMQLHAGNVQTVVETVDLIPCSSSGKFKAVICKLSLQDKRRVGQINTDENGPLRTSIAVGLDSCNVYLTML